MKNKKRKQDELAYNTSVGNTWIKQLKKSEAASVPNTRPPPPCLLFFSLFTPSFFFLPSCILRLFSSFPFKAACAQYLYPAQPFFLLGEKG